MRRRSLFYIVGIAVILGVVGIVAWVATLRKEERHTADTVAALRNDLRSDDIHKRADAARAIYKLGPLAKDAVPELVAALKLAVENINAEHVPVMGGSYQHFVLALWAIGKPAEAALLDLLDEKEPAVRLATVLGLHPGQSYIKLDQEQNALAVIVLRKALRDKDNSVRIHACGELGDFKQFANDILPELLELRQKDPDERVRRIAEIATESIER
jgi:HEAT repeat protein